MPNLRSYERAQLLALPAGAELDELVHAAMNRVGYVPQYSRDVMLVGVMLVKLREYWDNYDLRTLDYCKFAIDSNSAIIEGVLPHVCALALVLAAWEKEKK